MALTTVLNEMTVRDNKSFALCPARSINNYVLTANVAVDVTVADLVDVGGLVKPSVLIFNSTGNFYVKWSGAGAAVPGADIVDGTGVELKPSIRRIGAETTVFSMVSPSACVVTIALYSQVNG